MIVDPSAGRNVIWIRHSGRSAATSMTRLPSSSGDAGVDRVAALGEGVGVPGDERAPRRPAPRTSRSPPRRGTSADVRVRVQREGRGEVVEDLAPVGLGRRDSVPTGPGPSDCPPGTGVSDGDGSRDASADAPGDGARGRTVADGAGDAEAEALPQPATSAPATTAASARAATGRIVTAGIDRHRSPEGRTPAAPATRVLDERRTAQVRCRGRRSPMRERPPPGQFRHGPQAAERMMVRDRRIGGDHAHETRDGRFRLRLARLDFPRGKYRTSVLPSAPAPRRPHRGRLRRAPLPQPLLVPRRRVGARRPGRAGGRARARRRWRSPTTRACTARSGSRPRPRRRGCTR